MKFFFFIFIFFSNIVLSQNLSVKSFKILENDLSARLNGTSEKDLNNRLCAIIKVQTLETGFDFDNGILGIVKTVQNKGEIWVYVPRYTKFLTISHSKLGVLRSYEIPMQIDEGVVYELVLISGRVEYLVNEESINGFLTVETNTTEALVEIDDKKIGLTTPIYNYSLTEGSHKITVSKKNYITISETININRDENNKLFYNLKLKAGNLIIKLNPEVNAKVLIDGDEQNVLTPDTIKNVLTGKHTLSIIKEFYETIETEFTIKENETLFLGFNINPLFGSVNISVTPKDAEIWINKKFMGRGSFIGKVYEGIHFLELKKENYHNQQKNFSIKIGDDVKEIIELKPITGSLSIITEPIDLSFTINDVKYSKKTPVVIRDLLIGNYKIKILKDGYKSVEKDLQIKENKTTEINEKINFIIEDKKPEIDKVENNIDKVDNNIKKHPKNNFLFGLSYFVLVSDKFNGYVNFTNLEVGLGLKDVKKNVFYGLNTKIYLHEQVKNSYGNFYEFNADVKYFKNNYASRGMIGFVYALALGYGFSEKKQEVTNLVNSNKVISSQTVKYEYLNFKCGLGYHISKINSFLFEIFYNLNYTDDLMYHNYGVSLLYYLNFNRNKMRNLN